MQAFSVRVVHVAVIDLLLGRRTHPCYRARKIKRHAGKWMIAIQDNLALGDIRDSIDRGLAILYGLMTPERWNARYNPNAPQDAPAGNTQWITIGAIVFALLMGTTVLMASLAFSFQRYFEYQIEEAHKISQ